MKPKNYLTEFDALLAILTVCIIFLSVPNITRFFVYDSIVIGEEAYYHTRIARELAEEGFSSYDEMVAGGRPYIFNLYHFPLAHSPFRIYFTSKFLPYLFGILSALLFYEILKKFNVDLSYRLIVSLLLVSSPVFIYVFTSSALSMAIFLGLLGLYLLLKKGKIPLILSVIILSSTMFFGFLNSVITLLLIFSAILIGPEQIGKKRLLIIFLISLATFSIFYISVQQTFGLPEKALFVQKNILKTHVSELGGNGFSVFLLLLTLIGLITAWKNKYRLAVVYIVISTLLVLSYSHPQTLIYLGFIFSVSAGYALVGLIKTEWKLKSIKNITLLVLVLGIFFSSVSYLSRIGHSLPNQNIIASLEWLKYNSEPGEIVFSHYSKGFWIEDIARRPVVMDGYFGYINANQRHNDSNQIFQSRNLVSTKSLLEKYEVTYIWIDPDMKRGEVWTKEKQGLLFLFRNNETFKNIYNNRGIEIWRYLKEG